MSFSEFAQTTLGRELGQLLDITAISLDTLAFLPGWRKASADEFRGTVVAAMSSNDKGWVIDGNYTSILGSMVPDNATDIICEFNELLCSTYDREQDVLTQLALYCRAGSSLAALLPATLLADRFAPPQAYATMQSRLRRGLARNLLQ